MSYTRAAVERAMKGQEVILRALSGRQSWLQVAEVLGVSARTVRRLRLRYQHAIRDHALHLLTCCLRELARTNLRRPKKT